MQLCAKNNILDRATSIPHTIAVECISRRFDFLYFIFVSMKRLAAIRQRLANTNTNCTSIALVYFRRYWIIQLKRTPIYGLLFTVASHNGTWSAVTKQLTKREEKKIFRLEEKRKRLNSVAMASNENKLFSGESERGWMRCELKSWAHTQLETHKKQRVAQVVHAQQIAIVPMICFGTYTEKHSMNEIDGGKNNCFALAHTRTAIAFECCAEFLNDDANRLKFCVHFPSMLIAQQTISL